MLAYLLCCYRARKDVGPSDSSGAARETRAIGSSTSNTRYQGVAGSLLVINCQLVCSSDEHGLELPQADMRRRHSTNSVKQLGVVTSNSSGVDSPGSERATKRAQGSKRVIQHLPSPRIDSLGRLRTADDYPLVHIHSHTHTATSPSASRSNP